MQRLKGCRFRNAVDPPHGGNGIKAPVPLGPPRECPFDRFCPCPVFGGAHGPEAEEVGRADLVTLLNAAQFSFRRLPRVTLCPKGRTDDSSEPIRLECSLVAVVISLNAPIVSGPDVRRDGIAKGLQEKALGINPEAGEGPLQRRETVLRGEVLNVLRQVPSYPLTEPLSLLPCHLALRSSLLEKAGGGDAGAIRSAR